MTANASDKIAQMMQMQGVPPLSVRVFLAHYQQLLQGGAGYTREDDILPMGDLASLDTLPDYTAKGAAALGQTVVLKLNGGLGTSMGLEVAKSTLPAKDGYSFLQIICRQVLQQRQKWDSDLPLLFMNSFNTQQATQKVLDEFGDLQQGQKSIPFCFQQSKVPKIFAANKQPAEWGQDPSKIWAPAGHGDIYTALQTSGILDLLLAQGVRYCFIANADNLGANLDLQLLGYFAEMDSSFMMEVVRRTDADRKGGHLAQAVGGGLLLREFAQCHQDDLDAFQDIGKHIWFNSNNLWLRLDRLREYMDTVQNIIALPLIHNHKTIDPTNPSSPAVIQLETAMGAIIANFADATAIAVPRRRFIPVKTCNDLVALRSNAYILDDNACVRQNPSRQLGNPRIDLDAKYFATVADLATRFPNGIPNLCNCRKLEVIGDVVFAANVTIIGDVTITSSSKQVVVGEGTVLDNQDI